MLTLLVDNDKIFQDLVAKAPTDFPWDRVNQIDGGFILGKDADNFSGSMHNDLSELATTLASEILVEVAEYELESRKGGHPLLMEVRRRRYLAADTAELLQLASQILKWSKLMKKKGY